MYIHPDKLFTVIRNAINSDPMLDTDTEMPDLNKATLLKRQILKALGPGWTVSVHSEFHTMHNHSIYITLNGDQGMMHYFVHQNESKTTLHALTSFSIEIF